MCGASVPLDMFEEGAGQMCLYFWGSVKASSHRTDTCRPAPTADRVQSLLRHPKAWQMAIQHVKWVKNKWDQCQQTQWTCLLLSVSALWIGLKTIKVLSPCLCLFRKTSIYPLPHVQGLNKKTFQYKYPWKDLVYFILCKIKVVLRN